MLAAAALHSLPSPSQPPHLLPALTSLSHTTRPPPARAIRRRVLRLPSVRLLSVVLVTCRLGMLPAEAAAPLKLLEKGATKEALAGLVSRGWWRGWPAGQRLLAGGGELLCYMGGCFAG